MAFLAQVDNTNVEQGLNDGQDTSGKEPVGQKTDKE